MDPRPHRFLQFLQELGVGERWHELPALTGAPAGPRQRAGAVEVIASGRAAREVKLGVRLVLKQVARLLYLSPLLIGLRFALGAVRRELGDLVTVGFVLLVVAFFALLNLYIVVSVVAYFAARRGLRVVPPFEEGSGAIEAAVAAAGEGGGEVIRRRGVVTRLAQPLVPAERGEVLRDLWALEAQAPWRLLECVDFALVGGGDLERPVILQFISAPLVVAPAEPLALRQAIERLSPGTHQVFDLGPALQVAQAEEQGRLLSLAEGDTVEVIGRLEGTIPNCQRFELGRRVCALGGEGGASAPYRGAAGEEGLLVVSTAERPICLRKLTT